MCNFPERFVVEAVCVGAKVVCHPLRHLPKLSAISKNLSIFFGGCGRVVNVVSHPVFMYGIRWLFS